MKTLITYVYVERNDPLIQENLIFFLKLGVLGNHDYHYNIVINGHCCSIEIPQLPNLSIIRRENTGRDFGAYAASISSLDLSTYDYFIFINDTCRGPFIPTYVPSRVTWVEMFLGKIDDKVKLTGPTWFRHEMSYILGKESIPSGFSSLPLDPSNEGIEEWFKFFYGEDYGDLSHIQTMAFGTDKLGLELARASGVFDLHNSEENKALIIKNHEVGLSKCILDNGYMIRPFQLSQFSKVFHEDIHKPGAYFGTTMNPFDVMFVKTNRINDMVVRNYTQWLLQEGS